MSTDTATFPGVHGPHAKTGTWWFLASEIPVFGGLIVSYIVLRLGSSGWGDAAAHLNFTAALINTFLLLTSSMTVVMAFVASEEKDNRGTAIYLGLTVLLGVGFLIVKAIEYFGEITHGFIPSTGIFWSFYYTMTGLHALHVLVGIVANLALWIAAVKGTLTGHEHRVEAAGLYWHFVDIVWIFLFPLLYLA